MTQINILLRSVSWLLMIGFCTAYAVDIDIPGFPSPSPPGTILGPFTVHVVINTPNTLAQNIIYPCAACVAGKSAGFITLRGTGMTMLGGYPSLPLGNTGWSVRFRQLTGAGITPEANTGAECSATQGDTGVSPDGAFLTSVSPCLWPFTSQDGISAMDGTLTYDVYRTASVSSAPGGVSMAGAIKGGVLAVAKSGYAELHTGESVLQHALSVRYPAVAPPPATCDILIPPTEVKFGSSFTGNTVGKQLGPDKSTSTIISCETYGAVNNIYTQWSFRPFNGDNDAIDAPDASGQPLAYIVGVRWVDPSPVPTLDCINDYPEDVTNGELNKVATIDSSADQVYITVRQRWRACLAQPRATGAFKASAKFKVIVN